MKNSKYFNASKVDLPSLDELRRPVDDKIRCRICRKFLGVSNQGGSNGGINDSLRGECVCLDCADKMEGIV